jgi:predicted transcriptional regulator
MNTHAQKLELIRMLLKTDSETILKKVKAAFKEKEQDFWDELNEEQKAAIERAIKQADKGELIPHEQVMKKIGKWR